MKTSFCFCFSFLLARLILKELFVSVRYYNAGERPTVEILYKHPELVNNNR